MTVSTEAVEAAAKALADQILVTSDELEADGQHDAARRLEARAALEAAAPIIRAEWEANQ